MVGIEGIPSDSMAPMERLAAVFRPTKKVTRQEERGERIELLEHVQAFLEPVMAVLGFCFLALLLLDYMPTGPGAANQARISLALQIIWVIFLLDFAVRFVIAPAKWHFLRQNWLGVLSLALPFLRPLRVFRAARAIRSLSLVRFLGGINRGIRVLRKVARGQQFAYVGGLTVLVTLAGAVGALYFDRGHENAPIQTLGDALWWAAAMVTTINNEKYVVSSEARVIALLLRLFAVSVFGFVTASIASYLIGSEKTTDPISSSPEADVGLRTEIELLRHELARVGDALNAANGVAEGRARRVQGARAFRGQRRPRSQPIMRQPVTITRDGDRDRDDDPPDRFRQVVP